MAVEISPSLKKTVLWRRRRKRERKTLQKQHKKKQEGRERKEKKEKLCVFNVGVGRA
jgi:hypothetical protein